MNNVCLSNEMIIDDPTMNQPGFWMDPTGKVHESFVHLCSYWGQNFYAVKIRLYRHKTFWDALQIPEMYPAKYGGVDLADPQFEVVFDHLENSFAHLNEMCEFYKISTSKYLARRRMGMGKDRALCDQYTPFEIPAIVESKLPKEVTWRDRRGKKYSSFEELCVIWDQDPITVIRRLCGGMELWDALKIPHYNEEKFRNQDKSNYKVIDHLGNEYETLADMCKVYDMSVKLYKVRRRHGWTVAQILSTSAPMEPLRMTI